MISTRSVELVIDTVVCLTLAKWETVSGQFGGYLMGSACESSPPIVLKKCSECSFAGSVLRSRHTLYHSISLYITLYHSISLYITLYHSISLYITLYHSISLYITLYHSISLYITHHFHITIVSVFITLILLPVTEISQIKFVSRGVCYSPRTTGHGQGLA